MLSMAGGSLGVLLAMWGVEALNKLNPGNIPRLSEVRLDWRVLAFTLLVSILTGVLFGLVPALQTSKLDLHADLKEGGRGASDGVSGSHLRNALVITEMALALMLLIGAGLLITSFWRLHRVDPGFQPEGLLTMALAPPATAYQNPEQITGLYDRLLEKIVKRDALRPERPQMHEGRFQDGVVGFDLGILRAAENFRRDRPWIGAGCRRANFAGDPQKHDALRRHFSLAGLLLAAKKRVAKAAAS